jgi:hypothetical protein
MDDVVDRDGMRRWVADFNRAVHWQRISSHGDRLWLLKRFLDDAEGGKEQRYAADGRLYTHGQFLEYYGTSRGTWLWKLAIWRHRMRWEGLRGRSLDRGLNSARRYVSANHLFVSELQMNMLHHVYFCPWRRRSATGLSAAGAPIS